MEEIDWSTGQIVNKLEQLGIDDETLIVWTSDNGAPRFRTPAGSNAPFATWGYSATEGGQRVPCVVHWPTKVPAGSVSDVLCSMMDILPTCARLANTSLPSNHIIDGYDLSEVLLGRKNSSPYDAFYYYLRGDLQAVRGPQWKLQLTNGQLFDMRSDPLEQVDVSAEHPEIVAALQDFAARARDELGDGEQIGTGQGTADYEASPLPQLLR